MAKTKRPIKRRVPDWAKRIAKIRNNRQESLDQFAKHFDVKRASVWEWEKGESRPSPESWLVLAGLAKEDDSDWCLSQGGEALQRLLLFAEVHLRQQAERAGRSKLARVAPLWKEEGTRGAESDFLQLPAEYVKNPGSTFYLVLQDATCGGALDKGDIVVVDRAETRGDPRKLAPFWNHLIVVKFTPPLGSRPAHLHDWHEGVSVGRLSLYQHIQGDEVLSFALLIPATMGDNLIHLRVAQHLEAAPSQRLPHAARQSIRERLDKMVGGPYSDVVVQDIEQHELVVARSEAVRNKMRTDAAFEIIGTVILTIHK